MNNVEKIKPTGLFTNYIYKAIPLAFDESMSYYETLCGLLSYLKNTVIPALNNNADSIIELQNLITELQNYVDNYFDNLDVQQEINNKLDEMAQNGTLQTLLSNAYLNDNKLIFMPVEYYENDNASGDCSVLIANKSKKVVMFDTGATHSYSLIKEKLQENNITHIDYLIISHFHSDHFYNYTRLIADNFINENTIFYLPKLPNTDAVTNISEGIQEFKDTIINLGCEIIYPNSTTILNIDDITITFFNCNDDDIIYYDHNTTDYNNYSICNYIESGNFTILMTGDIQQIAQEHVVNNGYIKKCDILKIPHHGWESATGFESFYLKARPNFAVASLNAYSYELSQARGSKAIHILNSIDCKSFCCGFGELVTGFRKNNYSFFANGIKCTSTTANAINLYVQQNYTGHYCDGSQEHPFKKLASAVSYARCLNTKAVNINIVNTYIGDDIVGISSSIPKIILNATNCTINELHITNSDIIVNDITLVATNINPLVIYESNVELNNVVINGNVRNADTIYNGRGIRAYYSKLYVNNCTISNKRVAISLYNGTTANIFGLKGTNNEYVLLPYYASNSHISLDSSFESDNKLVDAYGRVTGNIKNDTNLNLQQTSINFGTNNNSTMWLYKSGKTVIARIKISFEDLQELNNHTWKTLNFDIIPENYRSAFAYEFELWTPYQAAGDNNTNRIFGRIESNSARFSIKSGDIAPIFGNVSSKTISADVTYITNNI